MWHENDVIAHRFFKLSLTSAVTLLLLQIKASVCPSLVLIKLVNLKKQKDKKKDKDKRQMDKYRSFSHPVQDMRPYFMELIKP